MEHLTPFERKIEAQRGLLRVYVEQAYEESERVPVCICDGTAHHPAECPTREWVR